MKKNLPSYFLNLSILIVLYLLIIFLIGNGTINAYYEGIIAIIFINIILAVSLNLITGFLGQLSLCHAGFMAIGAYTSAIFTKSLTLIPIVEFPIAIVLGGVMAAIAGVVIGIPALRLKGDYLAIITLGFGEIIKTIILNLKITGGAQNLKNIPKHSNISWIYWIMIISVFLVYTLIRSRHGRAIVSIREDEIAAEASGINTTYYKIFAFATGAFLAGIAGVLYAHTLAMLSPNRFDYNYSIEMVIMVVLGGMGSITGSIISVVFLTSLPQILSKYAEYRMLLYSIFLIIVMIFKPSGLFGKYEFSISSLFAKIKTKMGKE